MELHTQHAHTCMYQHWLCARLSNIHALFLKTILEKKYNFYLELIVEILPWTA